MKLGPKEIKVVNEYFVRPVKNRLKEIFLKKGLPQLKTSDEIERPQRALDKEAIDAFMKRNPKADGGRMGFANGGKGRFSKDTNRGKLREYLKNLRKGSTINRQELIKKFGMEKATGSVTEVLNEFKNKNFKFVNLIKGVKKEGRKIEFTAAQKKLPMLLFGKTEDELTSTQRSNITTGKIDANTMTPYRVRQIYNPFSLKEYGKDWNDLTEKEKERVRAGKPPVDPNRIPTKKAQVQKELLELSKDSEIMDIFKNPNRTKSQYTKDLTRVKKILGKNTNAVARLTQLAAAVSGDDPVPGISTELKKGADFIYNNLPHTRTQRELDELKIGKIFGEKSIKTIKSDIRKTPGYIFSGDYNIDEVSGATSSVRRGTTPYGIFGQIIKQDINKKDKLSFDGNKSKKEKILQDAIQNARNKGVDIKTDKNVKLALEDFNKLVSDYEQKINKNIPEGDLKVRLFKASLDSPEKTIKNFNNFDSNYQNVFLNNYKNKGYSFNVPKDIKTIPQIAKDFQDPKIIKKVAERADAGSSRLYANPFFSPGILKEAFKQLPTPAGAVALNLGLGVDPTSAIDRASIAAEAAFAPALVKQAAKLGPVGQKIANLGLTPAMAARVARIASPLGIASLAAEGLYQGGKFTKKRMEELRSMTPEQRAELRRQGEAQAFDPFQAAGGGIAKLAGDRSGAMLTSMNPDKDGLQGPLNRGKKQ
jgi:hypothetical protein